MTNFEEIKGFARDGFWDISQVKDAAIRGVISQAQMFEIFNEVFAEEAADEILEYSRSVKIAEMSAICNNTITNGFDVTLNGGVEHFSLTTQDQLNLITLINMVATGAETIPYHADGQLCKFYTATEISAIITAATNFKTYHISYYNSLKAYIDALTDTTVIAAITYGTAIPAEYQSGVLQSLSTAN